jgi:NAD(P)-dependent dehydrogenase (short-subunit alcohol dehydrogenase family)
MDKVMNEKVAVVTGGAGGIGKAISQSLVTAGAKTIIVGRDDQKAKNTIKTITKNGGVAIFYRTDLSKEQEIAQTIEDIFAKFEKVDILVNNAAISGFMGPVVETPMEEVENVLKVNLISIFHLSKLVLPKMIENHFGRIINISSVAPRRSPANSASYNISKAGLNTLTKTLSKEVAVHGITVNAIAPGLVLTERILKKRLPGMAAKAGVSEEEMLKRLTEGTDTGRLTREEDVAELVMFLASKASQNITGEIINVAGGL